MPEYELNFPEERTILAKKGYPTLFSRPDWDRIRPPPTIRIKPPILPALELPPPPRPAAMQNLTVEVVGVYHERNLCSAPSLRTVPVTLSYERIKGHVAEIAPIEDPAVAEWMIGSGANDLICEMVEEEYKRLGSSLVTRADDPYIPGCKLEDMNFRSETGRVVTERGYSVVETPRGDLSVPVPGKAVGIFEDILCWGAVTDAWLIQWSGVLVKWKSLATNPSSRIRFPNFNGLVSPQFIVHEPEGPSPLNFVNMKITSSRAQNLGVTYRETGDYTQTILNTNVSLGEGENNVAYNLIVFPFVPTMVVQLQPEDQTETILDSYSTSMTPMS